MQQDIEWLLGNEAKQDIQSITFQLTHKFTPSELGPFKKLAMLAEGFQSVNDRARITPHLFFIYFNMQYTGKISLIECRLLSLFIHSYYGSDSNITRPVTAYTGKMIEIAKNLLEIPEMVNKFKRLLSVINNIIVQSDFWGLTELNASIRGKLPCKLFEEKPSLSQEKCLAIREAIIEEWPYVVWIIKNIREIVNDRNEAKHEAKLVRSVSSSEKSSSTFFLSPSHTPKAGPPQSDDFSRLSR